MVAHRFCKAGVRGSSPLFSTLERVHEVRLVPPKGYPTLRPWFTAKVVDHPKTGALDKWHETCVSSRTDQAIADNDAVPEGHATG